jgi:hypothetical protein
MGWLSKKTAGREPAWTPEYFKRYIKIKYPDAVYVNDAAARNARAAGKYTTFPGANAKLIKSKWFTNFGTNTVRDQGQPRNDLALANAKSRANAYLRTENPDVKKFKNNMNRITNASNIRLKNVKWHLLSRPIATPVNRKAEAKLVTLRSGKTALNEVANTAAAAAAAGVNRAWVDLKVAQQNASNTSKSTQLTPYQRRLIEMIANGNFANIYGNNEPKKRVALTKLLGGGTVDGSPAATADAIKAAMNAVLAGTIMSNTNYSKVYTLKKLIPRLTIDMQTYNKLTTNKRVPAVYRDLLKKYLNAYTMSSGSGSGSWRERKVGGKYAITKEQANKLISNSKISGTLATNSRARLIAAYPLANFDWSVRNKYKNENKAYLPPIA